LELSDQRPIGPVAELKGVHDAVRDVLLEAEPSLAVTAAQTLAKSLLLAGASELEDDIQRILIEYYHQMTDGTVPAVEFIRLKALKRQYHTLFNWDASNANAFFAFFGPAFRKYAEEKLAADEGLRAAIRDFLRLGSLRNQLVHGNFVAFSLEVTADEILRLYQSAVQFRDALPGLLRQI
jgi:hypothetical protein